MTGNSFGTLFRITTFGESHGPGVGVVVDGCPPRLPLDRRGDPARARSPAARAERDHHPAARGRRGRDPVGRARGPDAGHADRDAGPQPGPARRRLRRDADQVPPVARRLHLRGEVRHPRLAGRRPRERARDDRARRGRRGRAQGAGRRWRRSRSSPGCSGCRTSRPTVDPATVTRDAVDANIVALPRRGDGGAR